MQDLSRRQRARGHQVPEGRCGFAIGHSRPAGRAFTWRRLTGCQVVATNGERENTCGCHTRNIRRTRDRAGHCGTFAVPSLFEVSVRRLLVVLAALLLPSPVLAQNTSAGASYTLLSLTYPDQIPNGFGGWLTWDLSPTPSTIGFDIGLNFFPEDHPIVGRQTELLAGIRGGARSDRFGVFGRARPGLIHFSQRFFAPDVVCILIFPPPQSCLIKSTNAAVDLGGTVEIYPTRRSVLRIDVGDTLIRFARPQRDAAWKHNLQIATGAGVRF